MSERYSSSSSSSGGVGFVGLLTIAFIVLKLVPGNPVNDWSWWWVLSPIWITAAIIIGLVVISFVVWGVYTLATRRRS